MSYDYTRERENLFTESGARVLRDIRDNAYLLLKQAGAFQAVKAFTHGESFTMHAALDYLVETEELRLLQETQSWAGQYWVYVAGKKAKKD